MTEPLAGIRVIELSRHLAGPFAAMTLGDLGADVLKVEPPGRGDDTRGFPPYWRDSGESCYYLSTNRNKRGMTLDLASSEGQDILRKLVAEADILIENFRRGTLERWGLGYEQLREINPRLIFCTISAVGSTGPDRDRAGVDLLMQAYGGLMSITGEPGRPPVRVGTSLVDLTTGANAVQAILAALYVRERTGNGQRVESSLLEGQVSWMTYHAVSYFASGDVPERLGSGHASVAPYGAFPTSDGYLVVAVATDALWKRFCGALGHEELIADARFRTNPLRCQHRDDLEATLTPILANDTAEAWAAKMDAAGVPCSPVNTLDTVLNLPQVLYREMVVETPRDDIPDLRLPGIAVKLDETPGTIRLPPPSLGQHTDAVLTDLGYDGASIAALREAGVV
ncbi:MAG TPA: CoA transferase [Thermomicrobiales bacterium]|nr:CoA transferase [Thermomicrobiales bacterium]